MILNVEVIEKRLDFYIQMYEKTVKSIEENDEYSKEVKDYVYAIFQAKLEALLEFKREIEHLKRL